MTNKLIKLNKKWLITAAGLTALGTGLVQVDTAKADTNANDSSESASVQSGSNNSSESNVQKLRSNAVVASDDQSNNDAGSSDGAQSNADNVQSNDTDTTDTTSTDKPGTTDNADDYSSWTYDEPTVTTPHKTVAIDPTAVTPTTTVTPAISTDPNAKTPSSNTTIKATAQLRATNSNGTVLSQSNDAGANVIVDANATDLTAVLKFKNTTNKTQSIDLTYTFPQYQADATSSKAAYRVSDTVNEATFTTGLPDGLTFRYKVKGKNYTSYDAILAANPDFTWGDLAEIEVLGNLASGAGYTWNVPLTMTNPDLWSGWPSVLGVYNRNSDWTYTNNWLNFRAATPLAGLSGQYPAVTVISLGQTYQAVPSALQALMPKVGDGQIIYANTNWNITDDLNSADTLYSGGTIGVHLEATGIPELVKNLGYSMLLNADGTPQAMYTFSMNSEVGSVAIKGNGETSGNTGSTTPTTEMAKYIYITLRQVIDAKDSQVKIGDNWTSADNFVSAMNDQDQPLSLDQVNVTVSDPNGVLKDGKIVKGGSFKVTYAYQVADHYYDKTTPYIVSKTITVTAPTPATTNDGGTATTDDSGTTTVNGGTTTTDDSGTTIVNGGAGATGVKGKTPKVISGGAAAKGARTKHGTTTKGTGSQTSATTGTATRATGKTAATSNSVNTTTSTKLTTAKAATTTLPQTSDRQATGFVMAGLAVLLGAFGWAADSLKRKN